MWHTPNAVAHSRGAREWACPDGATWCRATQNGARRAQHMRSGPGVCDRRNAQAGNDALAVTSGQRGVVRDLVTASGRGARLGADAGGHRQMGTTVGHRRAGAPCGTAGGLGEVRRMRLVLR